MKISRFAPALILVATSAFAMSAPDDLPLNKVEAEAAIVPLPQVSVKNDPKLPQTKFAFHFKNGSAIADTQALDGTVRGLNDPRITPDNVTCSVFVDYAPPPAAPPMPLQVNGKPVGPVQSGPPSSYNPMPPVVLMENAPALGSKETTLDNGQTVIQQQMSSDYSWRNPQTGVDTQGQFLCYKVGPRPFTAGDIRRALGGNTQIQLSAAQTSRIMGDRSLRDILNDAGRSFGGASGPYGPGRVINDPRDPKYVPSHVTDEQTQGNFRSRSLGQYDAR